MNDWTGVGMSRKEHEGPKEQEWSRKEHEREGKSRKELK